MKPLQKISQRTGKRIELVNRRTLFTLSLVTITLLWLLKPNDNLLVTLLEQSDDPTVAIAFIRVLKAENSSPALDLALARQHHRIGRSEQGLQILLPLEKYDDTPQWLAAHQLYALLLLNLSGHSLAAKAELLNYLQRLPTALPDAQKLLLADYALQLGEPALAFHIRRHLPEQSATDLLALSLQANLVNEAATQAAALYQQAPEQTTLLQLLPILEQNQQGILALQLAKRHLQDASCDLGCLQYLIALALRQNAVHSAAEFSRLKANQSTESSDWLQAAELFEAIGDLPQATNYLQQVVNQQPTLSLYKKLHQYYRWQQQTQQALDLSKIIVQKDTQQSALHLALEDAMAESDLTAIADFHFQLAKSHPRTEQQLDEFIDANDKAYGAADTLKKLQLLLNRQPQQQAIRGHLARFYLFTGQPEQSIALWPAYANAKPHSMAALNTFVQAFISLGQPEAALEVLQQHTTPDRLSTSLLSNMLELATYTANLPLQRLYQRELLNRDDNELDTFLAVETHSEATAENQAFLWQLYHSTKAINILSALANQAMTTQDQELFAKAAAMLEQDHLHNNELEVQQLRVAIALQQQNHPAAKQLLLKLLAKHPDHPLELRNAGWLALLMNDQRWLKQLYPSLLQLSRADAAQLRLLAAVTERLGELQHALHWQQLLSRHPEVTAADKLNHALLAERFGHPALAQQLRWQVVSQLSEQLRQEVQGELSYQSLIATLVAPAAAAAQLMQKQQQTPDGDSLNLLAASTLNRDLAALQYWQLRLQQHGQTLNDTLSLTLALARNDKLAIRALAFGSATLTPLERASALAAIGDNAAAWGLAERYGTTQLSPAERAPLLRLAASLHPRRSHGWRTELEQHSSWNYHSVNLRYYQPVADSQLQLALQQDEGASPAPLLSSYRRQQVQLSWLTTLQDNEYQLELSSQLRQGMTKLQSGQQLQLDWQSSPRFGHRLNLRHQMPSEQSRNLYMFGHEHRLAWQPQWQATRYQSYSATLAVSHFATDFNEHIGRQWQLQMQVSEQLSRSPDWRWYGLVDWQRNTLSNNDFSKLSDFSGSSYSATDFLSPRYQRLAVGQQLTRGQVGEPGPQQPHFRYWLDTAVGYNLITNNIDYTINVGFGVRLFGTDELFIKSSWQSADPQGRESLSFNLGYFFDF